MDDEGLKMLRLYGMSEEDLTAAAKYVEEISGLAMIAIDELYEALLQLFGVLQGTEAAIEEISLVAYEAAERADYLSKERKRWGHPPKKPYFGYKSPVRSIRPCARSRI